MYNNDNAGCKQQTVLYAPSVASASSRCLCRWLNGQSFGLS
jgi:hypothetical protein